MAKKKILIIIPSLGIGGAENVLLNFLRLMDCGRYTVDLFVVLNRGVLFSQIPKEVNLRVLHYNRYVEKLSRILYTKFNSLILYRLFGRKIKGSYDFGLCFLDSAATEYLFHNAATIKKKAAIIQSSYKSWSLIADQIKGAHFKKMATRYKKLDTIISVSNDAQKEFIEIFGDHPDHRVIYNPINIEKVRKKSLQYPEIILNHGVINFIAVGRLIPVKGYDILLKAAKIVKKNNSNFHLYIVGHGSFEKELKHLALALEVNKLVTFTGYVENIYPLIKQADVYIMPSRSEGLPTALCEALILGKPLIATNVSGCRETIQHGDFGLMPEPNENDIAEAMVKMIQDPELRKKYSLLAQERAIVFEDSAIMKQYYSLFDM